MRLLLPIAMLSALMMTVPASQAHLSDVSLGGIPLLNAPPSGQFECTGGALLPSTDECIVTNPSGSGNHFHITFWFPITMSGTEEVNIQESTVFVGDYVTWYDRVCTQPFLTTTAASVICVGGQLRDWHTTEFQKIRMDGQSSLCLPEFCGWKIVVDHP